MDLGERVKEVEVKVERIEHVLDGNGQPGFVRTMTDFVAEWKGRDAEQKAQTKRNNAAWNLRILAITAVFGGLELYFHGCAGHTLKVEIPTLSQTQDAAQPPTEYHTDRR